MGAEPVAEQSRQYQRDGYLLVPDVLTAAEVQELLAETAEIARGYRTPVRGLLPIEPDASDDEALGRYLAIHFPHKTSELIRRRYLAHPRFAEVLANVVGPKLKCMQSMLFVKPAGKPGQAWHQDEYEIFGTPNDDDPGIPIEVPVGSVLLFNGYLHHRSLPTLLAVGGRHRSTNRYPP